MKKELKIKIYTDGACSDNPGPGGWGALLLIKSKKAKDTITIKGGEKHTTNNRMELQAVVKALEFVYKNLLILGTCDVKVFSDSAYVVNSINNKSLDKWSLNGWKTTRDTDVANRDLWEDMLDMIEKVQPKGFIKVKGHSDNKFNNYIDKIAVEECEKYKQLLESL